MLLTRILLLRGHFLEVLHFMKVLALNTGKRDSIPPTHLNLFRPEVVGEVNDLIYTELESCLELSEEF